jgi:hypothetical protein
MREKRTSVIRPPSHGVVRPVDDAGELAYIPDADYAGPDEGMSFGRQSHDHRNDAGES